MVEHTPGPWQVVPAEKAEHQWVVGDAEGGSVASCEPMGPWMSAGEATANARLIAAAPTLLAELSAAVGYMRNARIDLETGAPKATAIRTLDGGLKRAEAALAKLATPDTAS